MTVPKTIIIEGITGTGKSNLAQFVALQLIKRGVDCRWYFEFEEANPVAVFGDDQNILSLSMEKWRSYLSTEASRKTVDVIDGRMLNLNIDTAMKVGLDSGTIIEKMESLIRLLDGKNVCLVLLTAGNMEKLFGNTFKARDLEKWYIEQKIKTDFCKDRGLSGAEAVYRYYEEVDKLHRELLEKAECRKMTVDVTDLKWEDCYAGILSGLGLEPDVSAAAPADGLERFTGEYRVMTGGKSMTVGIKRQGSRLLMNGHPYGVNPGFEMELRLVRFDGNSFVAQGHPLKFEFAFDGNGKVTHFRQGYMYDDFKIAWINGIDAPFEKV